MSGVEAPAPAVAPIAGEPVPGVNCAFITRNDALARIVRYGNQVMTGSEVMDIANGRRNHMAIDGFVGMADTQRMEMMRIIDALYPRRNAGE